MSTSANPTTPSSETIKHTKEQWLKINPFLSEEEAQNLVNNPPRRKSPSEMEPFHDYQGPL